jgi:hypothetical protein
VTLLLALALASCGSGSATMGTSPAASQATSTLALAITSPTTAPSMVTTDSSLTLAGTATGDSAIVEITWQNDRGGSGTANGTDAWQTGTIALQLGDNRITVTATDTTGAKSALTIVVTRESGQTGSVTLSWSAPTARTDGSPLTNLAGYHIYYGRMSGTYDYSIKINNAGILTYVVDGLVAGDWYFAMDAYDTGNVASERSNEILRRIN